MSGGKISIVDRIARGTGINAEKSLWNLMFVSTGKQSFVLGRGKFADELMAPDFSKKGVRRFGYQGFTLFGDDQQAMLMVNSSTIAIADTPTLRWLVDQRSFAHRPPRAPYRAHQRNPPPNPVLGSLPRRCHRPPAHRQSAKRK